MRVESAAKMRQAQAFQAIAQSSVILGLMAHVFELPIATQKIWTAALGTSFVFALLFLAVAPISSECKIQFWKLFARTHTSHFVEQASLRASCLSTFQNLGWLLIVVGSLSLGQPLVMGVFGSIDQILDKSFTPIQVRKARAQLEAAEARYKKNPGLSEATRDYAYLLARVSPSQKKKALKVLDKALSPGEDFQAPDPANSPMALDLLFLRASVLVSLKRSEEAVTTYRKILLSRPEDVEVRHNLGLALIRLNKFEEAEIEFKKAVRRSVDDLKRFKNDFNITPGNVKEKAAHLLEIMESLKFRTGASAYQLALVSFILKKSVANRHLQLSKQLGYPVKSWNKDKKALQKQASKALK